MKTNVIKPGIDRKAVPAAMIDLEDEPDVSGRLERIATSAYYRAEARGFVPGLEMEDWLQSEAEVDADMDSGMRQ